MSVSFDFIGPICDENFLALRNFIMDQPKPITSLLICISSTGGSVPTGISMYNYLKRMPFPIQTYNLGEVSSAALLLFLAGTSRHAEPISKFMIHPLTIGVNGDLQYHRVKEIMCGIDADIQNYKKIVDLETNSLNGKYDIEQLLKSESLVLQVQSARECGIIKEM